jgi:hypothetical protein
MFRPSCISLAVLSLLVIASGCAARNPSEGEDVAPEVRFDELTFEVYRGPSLDATGTLGLARMRRDTSDVAAERIRVDFPPADEREAARVTAARGKGNATTRWFQAEGGVRAEQGDDVVETERARFEGKDRLVRGDAPVTVHGDAYVLSGPGFTLDPDERTVRIEGGASLGVRADGGGRPAR